VTAAESTTLPVLTPADIRVASRRNDIVWMLFGVVAATVFVICGWLIYLQINHQINGHGLAWGVAFAFVPVVPLTAGVLWLDRFDPMPPGWLLVALLWGAFAATYAALQINTLVAERIGDIYGASARSAVFVAPWVEEALKGAVILLIAYSRKERFNGIVDGLVLGGLVGIGFAFTENILYYGNVFERVQDSPQSTQQAIDAVQHLFLWRGVAAPFVHPMFTMLTGIGIGVAVRYRRPAIRVLAPVAGYVCAVVGHMGYNAAASFTARTDGLWPIYVAILLPMLLILVGFALWVRRREQRILATRLSDYVAYGWLTPRHIAGVATVKARASARRSARRRGSRDLGNVRSYQRVACELGFVRDKIARGVAGQDTLVREAELLASLRVLAPLVDTGFAGTYAPASSIW
jgi:RsiW-degrading membrane proteinase PrsW (M82 family)